jgi:lipid II:glycine glycyltransferase (peptidoglycan interpeptide bridge formation enzyme)
MDLEVREESNLQVWEQHLKSFSATPFFSQSWLECFRTKNHIPIYLEVISGGKTICLEAGLRIEPSNALFKRFLRILFFFSGPAIVDADDELRRLCLSSLIRYAKKEHYTHIKMQSWDYPYEIDTEGMPFQPLIRKEYILDMRVDLAELRSQICKRKLRYIKAAERNGLTFHESSSPETLDDLLSLLEETRSLRLSKHHEDYHYFYISYFGRETLYELAKNKIARVFYVQRGQDIICVCFAIACNNRAYGLFIGANQEAYDHQVPTFINHKIIEKFKGEGIEFLNLGGVPSDSSSNGLIHFKASLGAREHVCTGGRTHHLQSRLMNCLTDAYSRLPDFKIKKIIKKKLVGRNYA